MPLDFSLHFDRLGRTSETDDNKHIRNLIEQVLFTAPGERVNRPNFGSGLLQLTFQPNNDGLAMTTQMLVQSALQEWLGDLIEVNLVQIANEDERLLVMVEYTVLRTRERQTAQFTR